MSTMGHKMMAPAFRKYKAWHVLRGLAANPYDLTKTGNLSPDRIERMAALGGEFKLLYGTERINDDALSALKELALETDLITKMQAMQSGEIVNRIDGFPSENRAALHTALRDHFTHPNSSKEATAAAKAAKAELDKLHTFISQLDKEGRFTDLIQIGIGGSELGPKALFHALKAYAKPNRKVHFLANIDPDESAAILKEIDPTKTMVVVVSKSGKTIETTVNEEILRKRFEEAGCKAKEHFIAVTGEGSPMDNPERYLASFYIWDYIGGRFSATSMVGGVMLAFAFGFDAFMGLLKGAHAMDRIALNADFYQNLPLLAAMLGVWNRNFLHEPTIAILPYSHALSFFVEHLQQLMMESNGKRIDKQGNPVDYDTGPIIWGAPGTNGQHSFYQLLHQGTTLVPCEFIGFRESQYQQDSVIQKSSSQEKLISNLIAQSIAMAKGEKNDNPNKVFPGNRPSHILFAKKLDPYTLGQLLAYYEHKTAFQGFLWDINSFDQEGVELGKMMARKITDLFGGRREGKRAEKFQEAEAILHHLEML